MKQTYKLLGYLLLGIGAYTFLNANTEKTQAIAQPKPIQTCPSNSSHNRYKITLFLNNLSDLKVTQGQRINVGDVISDRNITVAILVKQSSLLENIEAQIPTALIFNNSQNSVAIRTLF